VDFQAYLGMFSFQKITIQSETFIKYALSFLKFSSHMARLGQKCICSIEATLKVLQQV
jgi:hypothetical protein